VRCCAASLFLISFSFTAREQSSISAAQEVSTVIRARLMCAMRVSCLHCLIVGILTCFPGFLPICCTQTKGELWHPACCLSQHSCKCCANYQNKEGETQSSVHIHARGHTHTHTKYQELLQWENFRKLRRVRKVLSSLSRKIVRFLTCQNCS
jgi:hypothetical protein